LPPAADGKFMLTADDPLSIRYLRVVTVVAGVLIVYGKPVLITVFVILPSADPPPPLIVWFSHLLVDVLYASACPFDGLVKLISLICDSFNLLMIDPLISYFV
jgi:hypothetical protein